MIFLRVLYVVAIAVLLVFLVIVGVEAFYPEPSYPEYPEWPRIQPPYDSPEYEELWQEWQEEWNRVDEAYQQEAAVYQRSIFFLVLPLGAVFAIGGTFIRRRLDIFGAGLILGGMGVMITAITPYDLDSKLRFAGIAAALAVLVFVGYKVFNSLRRH
jgi:hypothetical protein